MIPAGSVSEAFVAIAELGNVMKAGPLNKLPACWELELDATWKIAVNGHQEERVCSYTKEPIPPFHAYIEYNGWPAGILSPHGGIVAAGTGANEYTFIAAVRARIERESLPPGDRQSVIVVGPTGCGKTTRAKLLLAHFGLEKLLDPFEPGMRIPPTGTLALANSAPTEQQTATARVIEWEDVMRRLKWVP